MGILDYLKRGLSKPQQGQSQPGMPQQGFGLSSTFGDLQDASQMQGDMPVLDLPPLPEGFIGNGQNQKPSVDPQNMQRMQQMPAQRAEQRAEQYAKPAWQQQKPQGAQNQGMQDQGMKRPDLPNPANQRLPYPEMPSMPQNDAGSFEIADFGSDLSQAADLSQLSKKDDGVMWDYVNSQAEIAASKADAASGQAARQQSQPSRQMQPYPLPKDYGPKDTKDMRLPSPPRPMVDNFPQRQMPAPVARREMIPGMGIDAGEEHLPGFMLEEIRTYAQNNPSQDNRMPSLRLPKDLQAGYVGMKPQRTGKPIEMDEAMEPDDAWKTLARQSQADEGIGLAQSIKLPDQKAGAARTASLPTSSFVFINVSDFKKIVSKARSLNDDLRIAEDTVHSLREIHQSIDKKYEDYILKMEEFDATFLKLDKSIFKS